MRMERVRQNQRDGFLVSLLGICYISVMASQLECVPRLVHSWITIFDYDSKENLNFFCFFGCGF